MSLSELKKLDFYELFEGELGGVARDREMAAILDQCWPDCSEGVRGNAVMAPADSARLEQLFKLFGVPMNIADNSLKVVGHAYDVFSLGLSSYVSYRLQHPDTFLRFVADWPEPWQRYVEAVATCNTDEARRLANELQPLSPDCVMPPKVPVFGTDPPARSE
jgi:hypothetical protein